MLGGNNNDAVLPFFLDENRLQYPANATNQLQLFGNLPVGCNVDLVNYFGNEHIATLGPNKRSRAAENISSQQHFDISLNYNACLDDSDRSASMPNQNPVSTGLRLSYDDDERNSSVTSGSGSMTGAPPTILALGELRTELDRQKKELDRYIKVQEENLVKGLRDIEQRHMASFLTALEKGVSQKLREKDLQIETINQKNRELLERINQVATEAQNWQYVRETISPPFLHGDFMSSIPSISKQYQPLGYSWSLLCIPSDRTLVCFRTRFDYFAKASPDCHETLVLCDLPLERGLFVEFQSILLLLRNRNVSIASRFL